MPNFCSLSVSSCLERTVCPTIDWVPCGNDTLASLALFHLASKVRPAQVTFKKLLVPTDSCSGSLQRQSHSGPSILFSHDLPQMWSWIKLCPSMLIFFFLHFSNCPFNLDFPHSSQLHTQACLCPLHTSASSTPSPVRSPVHLSVRWPVSVWNTCLHLSSIYKVSLLRLTNNRNQSS